MTLIQSLLSSYNETEVYKVNLPTNDNHYAENGSHVLLTVGHSAPDLTDDPKASYRMRIFYKDVEIFDDLSKRINSFPLFLENINNFEIKNVVPIVNESSYVAEKWNSPLAMVFIDGGHSFETAMNDFMSWHEKIISGGALVIHDIFENPDDGGQAPYEVYMHALKNGFNDYERFDTIVCLVKS